MNNTDQQKTSILSYILLSIIFGILVLMVILIFNLFRQGTRIAELERGISLPQTGELTDEELDTIQAEILTDVLSSISESDEFKGETGDTGEAGTSGTSGDSFWTLANDSYYIISAGSNIYNVTQEGDVHIAGDIFVNDEALLGTILGDRQYTESNYVASLQTITASIDALDMGLDDVSTAPSIWTDAGTYIHPTTAGANSLTILDSGNVGIGTTSPGTKLEIAANFGGAHHINAIRIGNSIGGSIGDEFRIAFEFFDTILGDLPLAYIGSAWDTALTDGYLSFATYNGGYSEAMRIDSSGNVGIGTTGPGSALEVNGDITVGDDDWIGIGAAAERIVFDSTNDVSIVVTGGGLQVFSNATSPIILMGYSGNVASGTGAIVAGGGNSGDVNTASGDYSFVGGGETNTASAPYSTVLGGRDNSVTGYHAAIVSGRNNSLGSGYGAIIGGYGNTSNNETYTIIAGGNNNTIYDARWGAILGGYGNVAGQNGVFTQGSVAVGGISNTASGESAVTIGGWSNVAAGQLSFAAGRRAKANADGVFALADFTNADFTVGTANVFGARFSGGYWLTGGDVGIGTSGPDFKLDVSGGLRIEGTNALYFGGTGAGDTSGNLYHDGTDFVFSDTIKPTGYVSSDGSAGLTIDVIVKGSDGNDCTLNFKNGILTGENCP
ncbi:hypothetical protein ACFLY9_00055 [Patescibacteria group bacterium]